MVVKFCQGVRDFHTSCQPNSAEHERLTSALKLRAALGKILELMGKEKVGLEALDLVCAGCAEALPRLTKCIDARGQDFIKELIGSGQGDVVKFLEKAKAILDPPTPFLESCLSTCTLCHSGSVDLKIDDLGAKFKDILPIMAQYAQISCVNKDLMKGISEEKVKQFDKFLRDVDLKISEHVEVFKGNYKQLERLNDKYKSPGENFCGSLSSSPPLFVCVVFSHVDWQPMSRAR